MAAASRPVLAARPADSRGIHDRREFALEASQAAGSLEGSFRITAAPDRRGTILKYKADRGPIAYGVAVFMLRLALWGLTTPLICAIGVVPLALLGMFIAPINHHHQHVNSFRAAWLNRLYDLLLALQSGVGPYNWVLHHNLGHHVNYLNQPPHASPDESHWTRADGTKMGRLEYSVHLLLHHQSLSMIGASIDDPYSDDDLAIHVCSQLDVVRWPKVAAWHLHHPGIQDRW